MRANVNMMERMEGIIGRIEYKNWDFVFYSNGSYLQIQFIAPCHDNPMNNSLQKGRKWLISEHMTDSEIVQTAFLAIQVAEEHEMRETFKFEGQAIFGPHFDLHHLAEAISVGEVDYDKRVG